MTTINPHKTKPITRLLQHSDIAQLLELENEKWEDYQAASADDFADRIARFPDLCLGAFCAHSGRILTSIFLKPIAADFWKHLSTWRECTYSDTPSDTTSLFGISAGSRDPDGGDALIEFLWLYLFERGWDNFYLGSPIPGWDQWQQRHPVRNVEEYVMQKRSDGLPRDPQLRYYNLRGIKNIISVKKDYFPHQPSHDYGVIIHCNISSNIKAENSQPAKQLSADAVRSLLTNEEV